MNQPNKFLVAAFMMAAMLLPNVAQAMTIQKFDKMANQDQDDYIGDLIVGAEKVLTDEGRPDLAAQVKHLFTTKDPGDADVIGMVEFETSLVTLRVIDARNVEKNPGAQRLEVEHAMILALKNKGIILPKSFMHVGDNFHPNFPSKNQ